MGNIKVIFGSGAKQKQDILNMVGLKYKVVTSLVDEESDKTDPFEYVKELSFNKAVSVASQIDESAIIVSTDTVVYKDGKIYEKPKSKEEAMENLREMSGKTVKAITGLTIIDLYKDATSTSYDSAEVHFREISPEEIEWYVDNESKIFKCSGFVPLGKGALFIDHVDGDYNTFLGISPSVLFAKLKEMGYKITDFDFEDNVSLEDTDSKKITLKP